MKQTGKTWVNAEGHPTLSKYVPKHEQLCEVLGQRIAAAAIDLEARLLKAKNEFVRLAQEVLRNNPDQGLKTRFTFYTFDREYRIEYDIKEENVRVYQALKKNPSTKDYRFVDLSLTRAAITFPRPTAEEAKEFKEALEGAWDPRKSGIKSPDLMLDEIGLVRQPRLSDIINDEAGPLGKLTSRPELMAIEFVDTKGNSLTEEPGRLADVIVNTQGHPRTEGKGLISQIPPPADADCRTMTQEEVKAALLEPREGPGDDDDEESTFIEEEALEATPKPEEELRLIPGTATNKDGADILFPEDAEAIAQTYADREQAAHEQE